jgi:hypothetical protein
MPARPHTRLESGIVKPKIPYTGLVKFGCFSSTREPESVQEALGEPKWK